MAANTISILIQAKDDASKTIKGVASEMDTAGGRADNFKASLGRIKDVALGVYLPQLAGQILGIGKSAVMAAADYEQSLNIFRSVTSATADQMSAAGVLAKQLGKDIALPGISAKDAALAMVELAKAGLSVNDTMTASKGVLSLAKAGQVETAFAAEVTANALNAFSLAGTEANRVADLLAGAANGSSATVQDLAYGLQMASASAATLKMPIQDLVTGLGLMSNNGIKGQDAGTSLKTMMNSLTPTTEKASNAMEAMNVRFYDARGNFVGMRNAAKQLQEGTKNMTTEQKLYNLEAAFGSDAMRAAAVMAKEGATGFDKMAVSVNKQGAATELAAAQNSGLKGALENVRSVVETLAIEIGEKLSPHVKKVADYIGANLEPAVKKIYDRFQELWPSIKEAARQVAEYLLPKLGELKKAIDTDIIPKFQVLKPYIDDVATIFGIVLVGAIGLVIDAIRIAIQWGDNLIDWMRRNNEWAIILGSAFGTLAAAMTLSAVFTALTAGFTFLTTVTIPGVMLKIAAMHALILAPIAMPAIVVAAAVGSMLLVKQAADDAHDAINNAKIAAANLSNSQAAAKRSLLNLQKNGSAEQKARATKALNSGIYDGFATGGFTGRGAADEVAGVVHKGEYVVPKSQVDQSTGMPVGAGQTTNVLSGTFTFQNAEAVGAFWDRLDKTQRLARIGMA